MGYVSWGGNLRKHLQPYVLSKPSSSPVCFVERSQALHEEFLVVVGVCWGGWGNPLKQGRFDTGITTGNGLRLVGVKTLLLRRNCRFVYSTKNQSHGELVNE